MTKILNKFNIHLEQLGKNFPLQSDKQVEIWLNQSPCNQVILCKTQDASVGDNSLDPPTEHIEWSEIQHHYCERQVQFDVSTKIAKK